MKQKHYLTAGLTVGGLAIAGYTNVQGILGIVSGIVACISYTWFLLDITK